jgi:uncharacterized membrane protein YccC
VTAVREIGSRLRARARVTERLREVSPLVTWRDRGWLAVFGLNRDLLIQALKIGVSASLSWLIAQWIFHTPAPIYAPITASFVALVTLRASVKDAAQRVIGVLIGIIVATFLADLFGLHAWSIGLIVAVGFLSGKVLRLSPGAAAQIPVTGLLLLALGSASHPVTRLLDTLIGAAVAVVVNFLILPPNHVGAARDAVRGLAEQIVDAVSQMADGISDIWTAEQAARWLRTARAGAPVSAAAGASVDQAADSLGMHPGRSHWVDVLQRTQQALRTLAVVEIQVRVIGRTLRDTATNLDRPGGQVPMPMASDMLTSTAGAIDAFAEGLLGEDADAGARLDGARAALAQARGRITEINADLKDLVAANLSRGIYLGTLVVETERVLDQLEAGLAPAPEGSAVDDSLIDSTSENRVEEPSSNDISRARSGHRAGESDSDYRAGETPADDRPGPG